jgi:hypothetical protein
MTGKDRTCVIPVLVPDNVSDVSGMTMWRKARDDDVEESPG